MLFVVVMIASLPDRFLSLTTQRTNQLLSTSVMILALRPLHESQEKQEKGAHIAWYKTIYHYHCHAIIPNFICLPVHTNLSNPLHDYHHTSTTTKSIKPTKAEHKTYITRAPDTIYFLSFDGHCTWGNKVRLYRKQLTNLRCLIATRMTFATRGMYFSVRFTKKYLRRCIDPKLYGLPIKSGDGNTCIKARLTKGVDNRATITRGWAGFFPAANTKERKIYAFTLKCNYKRLRLTVHDL
ncbi:uncharacterized protein [Triticum aestivum]|nr:uncharacterized protein LOC123093813 isoform X2 [Triticum aestivum]